MSEKQEKAREVLSDLHKTGFYMDAVEVIMVALANAERGGMKRAAEIVEEFGRKNGSRYECGLMFRDILSEITPPE